MNTLKRSLLIATAALLMSAAPSFAQNTTVQGCDPNTQSCSYDFNNACYTSMFDQNALADTAMFAPYAMIVGLWWWLYGGPV
jgi:hypothetical protein